MSAERLNSDREPVEENQPAKANQVQRITQDNCADHVRDMPHSSEFAYVTENQRDKSHRDCAPEAVAGWRNEHPEARREHQGELSSRHRHAQRISEAARYMRRHVL